MISGISILAILPFVTPWLFWAGAAATSVPIIIHLLNKRRFRIVIWAAMDFLLAAQRRNARRLKFQRWLLLAIRCLALIILAMAVARFFLNNTALGNLLGNGERGIVIVWDDSYSMAYQNPGKVSHFEASRKLLLDYLTTGAGKSDKVAVVRASRGGEPIVPKPTLNHGLIKIAVQDATLSDASTDLAGALDKAGAALADVDKTAQSKYVIIITDLSRSSLPNSDPRRTEAPDTLKKAVAKLKATGAIVRVVDVGEDGQTNKGIVSLRTLRPVVVAGQPTTLEVDVANAADTPWVDALVTVMIDGTKAEEKKMPRIEAGGHQTGQISVTIPTSGRHVIEARIASDLVPMDDLRRLAVDVKQELPLLFVDGSPAEREKLGSVSYVQTAYGVRDFAPKVISEIELPRTALTTYAAVILSDLGGLDPAAVKNLKKYVEDGGLLMIFPGTRMVDQLRNIDAALGERGAKMLPAGLGQVVRLEATNDPARTTEPVVGVQFAPGGYTHEVLRVFGEADRAGLRTGLTTALTTQYVRLNLPADGSCDTILKYSDGSPAVVAKPVGRGKVILFASSADTTWTSFPAKPAFVPFLWELMYYGLSRETVGGTGGLTLALGEKINLPAEVAAAGTWRGPRNTPLQVTIAVDEKDGRARLASGPLKAAGWYGPTEGAAQPVVAVNVDPEEVDIRHVKVPEMSDTLGVDRDQFSANPATLTITANANAGHTGSGDLGLKLILAALALLVLETILARAFSAYR